MRGIVRWFKILYIAGPCVCARLAAAADSLLSLWLAACCHCGWQEAVSCRDSRWSAVVVAGGQSSPGRSSSPPPSPTVRTMGNV